MNSTKVKMHGYCSKKVLVANRLGAIFGVY